MLIHSLPSSSSLRLKILEFSSQENEDTHTCLLNIELQCLQRRFCAEIKSFITAHAYYISSKRVLSLWISQWSGCQCCLPMQGTNFWVKVLRFAILEGNLDMGIYVLSHNPASGVNSSQSPSSSLQGFLNCLSSQIISFLALLRELNASFLFLRNSQNFRCWLNKAIFY